MRSPVEMEKATLTLIKLLSIISVNGAIGYNKSATFLWLLVVFVNVKMLAAPERPAGVMQIKS